LTIEKVTKNFGMPWEKEYGYSQAVKIGDTIYLAGQVSHDDKGNTVGPGDMEAQMQEGYIFRSSHRFEHHRTDSATCISTVL
jgi:2-iminobutanoate/2-iminopropanoate deaminase